MNCSSAHATDSFGTEGPSSSIGVAKGVFSQLTVVKVNEETILEQPVKLGIEYERTWDRVAYDLARA